MWEFSSLISSNSSVYYYCLKWTQAQRVMACPKNGCNIPLDPCQTGVPEKRCGSIPQPLTFLTTSPTFLLSSPKLGLTSSVPRFLIHTPPCSYMLSWKSPVLQAEKVRELLPNMYCLEAVCAFAFHTYHSLEVFGGNTKINILIKLLLIPLK